MAIKSLGKLGEVNVIEIENDPFRVYAKFTTSTQSGPCPWGGPTGPTPTPAGTLLYDDACPPPGPGPGPGVPLTPML